MKNKELKPTRFVLDFETGEVSPCEDMDEWCTWFEENRVKKVIAVDKIGGNLEVRTAFLGTTFDPFYEGLPDDLFGTIVLRRESNLLITEQYTYPDEKKWSWEGDEEYFSATMEEALQTHNKLVEGFKNAKVV